MTTPGGEALCREAEGYYLDLLENDTAVPETIRLHVADCRFCRRQLGRLKRLMSEAQDEDHPSRPAGSGAVEALGRQFAWLDERVTCSHVRPFLPELLLPSQEIRIPTPITVHVDNCPACAADLAALRRQDLADDQLMRLSELYRHAPDNGPADCPQEPSAIALLAGFSLENADPETLDHLSLCATCRAKVYSLRESSAAGVSREDPGRGQALPCDSVRAADIFDWVVPYGSARSGAEAADESRRATATHVRSCPQCLEKVQALHRIVYGMAERADSPVCTVYHARGQTEGVRRQDGEAPNRYPVDVEVLHGAPAGNLPAVPAAAAGTLILPFRPLLKIALPALAAMIALTVYFAAAPTASGTNVGQLLKALVDAPNVHITTWASGGEIPVQDVWAARDLKRLMMGKEPYYTLYELGENSKRTVRRGAPPSGPVEMNKREYESARMFMSDCLAAVLPGVPAGAEARQTTEDASPAEDRPLVYETAWAAPGGAASPLHHRLRVLIDPRTGLPQRMEFLQKRTAGDTWECRTTKTFEYPATPAMSDAIRALFPAP